MTTGKTIALTRWTFVGKVISLLFNMLSRLVTTFLPRSKHLLISWLQSPSAVILEPRKIKSATVSTVSTSICHEVVGLDVMILVFWTLGCIYLFKIEFSPFLNICLEVELLDHMATLFLIFKRTSLLYSIVATSISFPTNSLRGFPFIHTLSSIYWRRKWQPTPGFLPGESHGQRSLADYNPWGHKELDMT